MLAAKAACGGERVKIILFVNSYCRMLPWHIFGSEIGVEWVFEHSHHAHKADRK